MNTKGQPGKTDACINGREWVSQSPLQPCGVQERCVASFRPHLGYLYLSLEGSSSVQQGTSP